MEEDELYVAKRDAQRLRRYYVETRAHGARSTGSSFHAKLISKSVKLRGDEMWWFWDRGVNLLVEPDEICELKEVSLVM